MHAVMEIDEAIVSLNLGLVSAKAVTSTAKNVADLIL